MRSILWNWFYLCNYLWCVPRKSLMEFKAIGSFCCCFCFPESLIVLGFIFRYVFHLDVTFFLVYFFYLVCGYPILTPLVRKTLFFYELPVLLCQKSIAQNHIFWILDSPLLCFLLIYLPTTLTVLSFVTIICLEVKWCQVHFATRPRF